jgi:hypothetical protein
VLQRLRELRPGQAILAERADGTRLRFVVGQAGSYPKTGFPTAAVFARSLGRPAPDHLRRRLRPGRGSYRDNLVVFARLGASAGNRG